MQIPTEHEANVFGQLDTYAKKIERTFHVTLIERNGEIKIMGEEGRTKRAQEILEKLLELSRSSGEACQGKDAGTEKLCGRNEKRHDCLWTRPCRYRKDISGYGHGNRGI